MKNLQKAYRSIFHRIRVLFEGPRESILPRKFYIESNVFELEKKYIFNKLWLFIGLTNELCEPHSWMRKKIINKEILITFDGHDYHALENVCPHKNMRLRSEAPGRALLYAATTLGLSKWMGALKRSVWKKLLIDRKPTKEFLPDILSNQIGWKFLFVNLDPNPIPFETQFDAKS